MQAILPLRIVSESVGLSQWAMPGVPVLAVAVFHQQVGDQFANIMQQGSVGDASGPGLGLLGLDLWRGARWQQISLAQLQCAHHDFQAVIQ